MSLFFVQGNVSDEDGSVNSDEKQTKNNNQPSYQYDFMDDDRVSNEKRFVRTEKDKKWNLIRDITVKINSALNNRDFEKVWSMLQQLLTEVEKAKKLIQKQGYPLLFLKCLKKINDEINEFNQNAEAKKKMKMNKHSATAFNTMKQKLKKIYPQFENKINEVIQKGEDQQESQQQSQSSSQAQSDEEDDKKLLQSKDPMERRKYWLKKVVKKDDSDEQREKEKKKDEEDEKEKIKDEQKKKQKKKEFEYVDKKKKTIEIASIKDAQNRIRSVIKDFVKIGSQQQREQYLETLDQIIEKSKNYKDFEKLSFYLVDIPIRIQVCRQMKLTNFPRRQWIKMFNKINQIYTIIRQSEEENLIQNIRLFDENSKSTETKQSSEEQIYLSLKTFLILIESQLKKSLIFTDHNQIEYYERLQDLIKLIDLMYKISNELFSKLEDQKHNQVAEIAFKVLEHVYFMDYRFITKIKTDLSDNLEFVQLIDESKLQNYANIILKNSKDDQILTKTLLYLIYNHIVNHREKGKQLLIISNIPEQITQKEYYTQAIYNRVIVQAGLSSFRNGNMFQTQQFLYEMCSYAKTKQNTRDILKQFLAQGYIRGQNQKQIPKNKILPSYLHLNVDLIEAVELIASMMLQIPYTLTEGGRITSKTFKKVYYEYERSYFIAEPLNNRDLIYSASCQLKQGNWQSCYERLLELSIWSDFTDPDTTKINLLKVIKQQSLKCYLIGNRKCFKSISVNGLAIKFALEEKIIRKLVCKMIIERNIQGSITQQGYLVFVQKKQTEMQKICQNLFSKLNDISTANEAWFNERVNYDSQEEQEKQEQELKLNRKFNVAINEKLKSILNKRSEKH